jgi:hypothetical protein
MGIRDWFGGKRVGAASSDAFSVGRGRIERFAAICEDDEMLLPKQVAFMKTHLNSVTTEVLAIMDPSVDEMLPEYAFFVPNLLAEFNENPNLAMIHGRGTAHAWIDVRKLKEVLSSRRGRSRNIMPIVRRPLESSTRGIRSLAKICGCSA